MAEPGSPDWWLDRLYKRLRDRQQQIKTWDEWYTGSHPAPRGYEQAEALFQRVMDTVGLNMMAVVADATLPRMTITGFKVNGKSSDEVWDAWQANNFDRGSRLVRQDKHALSEAYVMVAPGDTAVMTPEHPSQTIVEYAPGSSRERLAALKVWFDDTTIEGPLVRAWLDLGKGGVHSYAARTRNWVVGRSALALKPSWEFQESQSGTNPFGEVSIVPFPNRPRMLKDPTPEFERALPAQRRINKTLLDRMAMQDQGSFKAMWATGIKIPRDPKTGEPIESFIKAIDRVFINENPDGKYGQLEAEDIKQICEAVRDDVVDCAMLVPTSADSILGKLVNVAADGLKLAQSSEVSRARDRMAEEDDSWEDVNRLVLKAAGKDVPNVGRMTTEWRNPEFVTDTEQANAATVAITAGMPPEVAWARYFNASPDDVKDWAAKRAQAAIEDPVARALAGAVAGTQSSTRTDAVSDRGDTAAAVGD